MPSRPWPQMSFSTCFRNMPSAHWCSGLTLAASRLSSGFPAAGPLLSPWKELLLPSHGTSKSYLVFRACFQYNCIQDEQAGPSTPCDVPGTIVITIAS